MDGGMWVIKLDKRYTVSHYHDGDFVTACAIFCDQVKLWQELLLAAIGEQLSMAVHPDDEMCGVSVRIRHDSDIIQIWNQDSDLNSEAKVSSGVLSLGCSTIGS